MNYDIELYRRPEKKTIDEIVNIAKALTKKWFTDNVPDDIEKDLLFHDAICLKVDGSIASFIVFTCLDGTPNILLMGTKPDFRGMGLGSVLMKEFLSM